MNICIIDKLPLHLRNKELWFSNLIKNIWMNKYLLRIILSTLLVALPGLMFGRSKDVRLLAKEEPYILLNEETSLLEGDDYDFVTKVSRNTIIVRTAGCQGRVVKIYNLVGDLQFEKTIDSESQIVKANVKKGIYLVCISNKVRKVYVAD